MVSPERTGEFPASSPRRPSRSGASSRMESSSWPANHLRAVVIPPAAAAVGGWRAPPAARERVARLTGNGEALWRPAPPAKKGASPPARVAIAAQLLRPLSCSRGLWHVIASSRCQPDQRRRADRRQCRRRRRASHRLPRAPTDRRRLPRLPCLRTCATAGGP